MQVRVLSAVLMMTFFVGCGTKNIVPNSTSLSDSLVGSLPNPELTPGILCTPSDPNFSDYRYPEHIAYCNRNISREEKLAVAKAYGINPSDFTKYEFDHFIPLGIGGSDDPKNLWPQPIDEAHQKDQLELELFKGLADGTIKQADAVAQIKAWRPTF